MVAPVAPAVPDATAPSPSPLAISPSDALRLLYLGGDTGRPPCDGEDAVRCLIAQRYDADSAAAQVALALFDDTGDVAGVSPAETMEGGFRGVLHLVPELPVGKFRHHLEWVAAAARDYDDFFAHLAKEHDGPLPYRWRPLGFRFMRSVGRTTPSAYASGWEVAYNVEGSLNTSAVAVRELLFHEIFHLNDAAHGDWAFHVLGPTFDAIAKRCGSSVACLTPYAPTETKVRGGTYYAFQDNNGAAVREYAAELALRYYREQRARLHGEPPLPRFKCGPKENAHAWTLLVHEHFADIDMTPVCP
jgi:hypothetical protein